MISELIASVVAKKRQQRGKINRACCIIHHIARYFQYELMIPQSRLKSQSKLIHIRGRVCVHLGIDSHNFLFFFFDAVLRARSIIRSRKNEIMVGD